MSLFQRLFFVIFVLFFSLLAASGLVSVFNAQKYFSDQLTVIAEDTATSLGLTISHAAKADDLAQVQSMVDVIFDRGYYKEIRYRDFDHRVLVSRSRDISVEGVPSWFVDAVPIEAKIGDAEVVSGWMRLGVIEVDVHPGYAYRDLWRVVVQQVWLFCFATAVSALFASIALRLLLRPLLQVERQADAICRKEFPVQDRLPNTPELRRMVVAMNRMVGKIQSMFSQQLVLTENLRKEAHMDALTELPNRKEFESHVNAWLKSELGGGRSLLILFGLEGLKEINQNHGREVGDTLVVEVSYLLKHFAVNWPGTILARRGGTEFAVFIPGVELSDVEAPLEELKGKFSRCEISSEGELSSLFAELQGLMGIASSAGGVDLLAMLQAADSRMQEMTSVPASGLAGDVSAEGVKKRSANDWMALLKKVLANGGVSAFYQPVKDVNGEVIHHEAFARIHDGNEVVAAGAFWPLVDRFGLSEELDRAVLGCVLNEMDRHLVEQFCVNVSEKNLSSTTFREWLLARLKTVQADRLTIEMPEKILRLPQKDIRTFLTVLREMGVKVSLDHFGVSPSSLGGLQSLEFDFVKIDSRFTRELEQHKENLFYVKSLLQIAKSCDVKVIAEGIENEKDWAILRGMGIDGGQGYWFASPAPMDGNA